MRLKLSFMAIYKFVRKYVNIIFQTFDTNHLFSLS